jgi:hypothetical protein
MLGRNAGTGIRNLDGHAPVSRSGGKRDPAARESDQHGRG